MFQFIANSENLGEEVSQYNLLRRRECRLTLTSLMVQPEMNMNNEHPYFKWIPAILFCGIFLQCPT